MERHGHVKKYKSLLQNSLLFFKNHGLKKGSKIIVQAEKSIHCVCIYLSCLKLELFMYLLIQLIHQMKFLILSKLFN